MFFFVRSTGLAPIFPIIQTKASLHATCQVNVFQTQFVQSVTSLCPFFSTRKYTNLQRVISVTALCKYCSAKKCNMQYILNTVFSFKDIWTYLPIIFRGFHFMAQGFSNFFDLQFVMQEPPPHPPPTPFNYLLILFPGSVYEAESLDKITQTASACRSPLGNDSQIARCSVYAGCWTNLNAIYSWRSCDKAQASALWNRKINNLGFPRELGGYSMGRTPEQPTNSAFNRTTGGARWLDGGLYTKPCEEEWKCVSVFIYLNAAAAVTGGFVSATVVV